MSLKKRYFTIAFTLIFSILLSFFVGASLAVWDMGEDVSSMKALILGDTEKGPIIGETQKIVSAGTSIIDVTDNPVENIKDEIKADIAIPEAIKPIVPESEDIDESEESNLTEEVKEEKEVVVTSEISGIDELVRVGNDEVISLAEQIPARPVSYEDFPDPIETFPIPFAEVDENYFNDALFIGDSRMQGLGMYSDINGTFFAATAFQLFKYKTFKVVPTAAGKVPIFDAMPYDKFTKIYIKVGLNELGCVSDEAFINDYASLVNELRVMQPRAIIYVHAVLPVTAAKSETDRTHCNENIKARNELLKTFAEMNKCYYIDVASAVSDETGALKADSTVDGIHMYGKSMGSWVEYLRTHAVPWP